MKFTTNIVTVLSALGLAAVLTFVTATLAVAQPSEVWVDDDYCNGCPNDGHTWDYDAFDKIQNGIDAVASPGIVNVAAGSYEGKVVLKPQVSLLGAGIEVSIIDGMGLKEGVEDTVVAMASGSKISGFSIVNGGWNGVECRGVSAIIAGNLVAHHEAIGIHIIGYGSRNSIVSNNIVTDCASYMPKLQFVGAIFGNSVYGSPQIIHNTVVGNHYTGIGFCHPGTPKIKNNIVVGNLEGIGACGNTDPNNSHNNSWNNRFYNWTGMEKGVGAISSDPLFVDEIGGDYHLQKVSPSIDAGADVGLYIDMDRDVRPFGAGFDMGADEFVPSYIEIDINIQPRKFPNVIKIDDDECDDDDNRLKVAILTTEDFNALTVDESTVELGDATLGGTEMAVKSKAKDVDKDGDKDLLLKFSICELLAEDALNSDSTELMLTGKTKDGRSIAGWDSALIIQDDDDDEDNDDDDDDNDDNDDDDDDDDDGDD